jgi:hypothetical protein
MLADAGFGVVLAFGTGTPAQAAAIDIATASVANE